MIYVLLTGMLPWQKADLTDPHYAEYVNWKKRRTLRTPRRLSNFTARFLRLMKRILEPKPEKRATVKEVLKYIDDKWLVKPVKRDEGDVDNQSVAYSTFSMHSSKLEKDKVLKALKDHGIETTVDRAAKRKRIHEWLERSLNNRPSAVEVMEEEDEEESENIMSEATSDYSSTLTLKTSSKDRSSRSKLSNISSMNNIYDEGYQTASSNNSSVKKHQMQSALAKSTGNIDSVNMDLHTKSQIVFQKLLEEKKENTHNIEDRVSSLSNPHVHRSVLHHNVSHVSLNNHRLNHTNNSKTQTVVLPRATGIIQQSTTTNIVHISKEHLIQEHQKRTNLNQYQTQQQQQQQLIQMTNIHMTSSANTQQQILTTSKQKTSVQSNSHTQQTGKGKYHSNKDQRTFQRCHADSYFISETLSGHTSEDECLSDNSVNSVVATNVGVA